MRETLNRKETYSAGMVIFIALFYIMSLAGGALQDRSTGSLSTFGLTEFRMMILSGIYVTGGILLFRRKNAGWIIGVATLLNVMVVAFTYVMAVSQSASFTVYAIIPIAFFLLLLMSITFLFRRETRKRFSVTNKSYLLLAGLYLGLLVITYARK